MERERDGGREEAKHISMELTADGARVTNLKLDGKRLILTIEAQLSDSHLTATDAERPAPAPAPSSPTGETVFSLPGEPAPASLFIPAAPPPPAVMPAGANDPLWSRPGERGWKVASDGVEPIAFEPMPPSAAPEPPALPAAPFPTAEPPPARELSGALESIFPSESAPIAGEGGPTLFGSAEPAVAEQVPVDDSPRVIRLTGDDLSFSAPPPAPQPINLWGDLPPAPAPSAESRETPAMGAEPQQPFAQPIAMSEESSAFGGERHGEPQPAISFGQDLPLPGFAPAAAPGIQPPPAASAAQPPPLPQGGFNPVAGGVAAPFPGLAPASPAAGAAPGLAAPPPPAAAPAPGLAPPPAAPETPESGSTTVLIRYTCPKCKTQGMQAVDKVGTVVNCSNCGKAMRLVMKK